MNDQSNAESQRNNEKKKNGWWKWGVLGVVILPKLKGILSVLKMGKVGGTMISMFVSVGAYALLFPWQFAIGLVVMILIHELGHVWAAKSRGLPVSAPTFIPFLGALITMKRNPLNAETEAYIALGGPVIGSIGAMGAFWLGILWNSPLLFTIAMIGLFLNLINMLPIHPLDGGRIVTAVSRWFWLLGLIGGLFVIVKLGSILFFIIWAMFAWDLFEKYGRRNKKKSTMLPFKFDVPLDEIEDTTYLPGEDHRRRLPFTTFCNVDTREQKVIAALPSGLNANQSFTLPSAYIVHSAQFKGLKRKPEEAPTHLAIQVDIEVEPYENDRYYEVPTSTRWKYGAAYIGLAAFLAYMLFIVLPPYLPPQP